MRKFDITVTQQVTITFSSLLVSFRLQRVMMLESKVFHNNLLEAVTGTLDGDTSIPADSYTKELGLEILCWIAGVQICEPLRYKG